MNDRFEFNADEGTVSMSKEDFRDLVELGAHALSRSQWYSNETSVLVDDAEKALHRIYGE